MFSHTAPEESNEEISMVGHENFRTHAPSDSYTTNGDIVQHSNQINSILMSDESVCSETNMTSKMQIVSNKRLHYVIHSCSSTSSTYTADNILQDKPNDQSSRWSSDTSTPPQYLVLKLEPRPAIVTSITFGKYEKAHVCNLKRFKVFGGCEENNMIELIDSGLKNDTSPENFPLRHSLNGHFFPCRYVKIVPLQSWGPSFNFSIWHVTLEGEDSTDIIEPALAWHDQFREKEAIRLCLKHFRQKNYNEVFESLQKKTKIQLEHPRLTELHNCLVKDGNYDETEKLIKIAIQDGLFDEWINAQKPSPRWTPLILPEETLADDLLSGNASPAVQTPLANSGNITPDNDNHILIREPADVETDGREDASAASEVGGSSVESMRPFPQTDNNSAINTQPLPLQPKSRGGHQMVIDSSTQLVYLFGGWDGNKDLSDFWSYHIPTNKWKLLSIDTSADGGPSQRSCHKMVIDMAKNHIFILGRYLERSLRDIPQNIKSDFYMYDINANRWTQITDDTAAMGGPSLIFDHQMCIDQDSRTIYVFGGQSLFNSPYNSSSGTDDSRVPASEKIYSGLYEYHIPTNTWKKKRDDVACGSNGTEESSPKTLKSRSSHSMLFHPQLRKLFIFGGQRKRDEYLNDFFTYGVDDDQVEIITSAKGSGLSGDPSAAIPAVGHTQRATIDCQRSEIHVMTGLNKDKDKNDKRASNASASESRVSNSFWVYGISSNRWTCFYRNDNSSSSYWSKMQRQEPRPRYAHQLVYDDINRMHYMFGGNPGGRQGKEDRLRLGDFWKLHLYRPDHKEILRRCCLKARQSKFMELTYDENSLAKALSYLQTMLSEIVDHSDDGEEREYQLLASQLFKFPSLPVFSSTMVCPVKKSKSFDGTTKNQSQMLKDTEGFDDNVGKLERKKHKLRTELFDVLAEHFPSDMTHPKGNLIDLIPHPVDLN